MLEKVCDVQINYYRMFYNNLVPDMVSDSRLTKEELFLRARPIDDIFGKRMLENNLSLAQFMLRIITGDSTMEITEGHAQHVSSNVDNHKGIITDSYYRDREGNIYVIEFQRKKRSDYIERFRFYQGLIDTSSIEKGEEFGQLKKLNVYVICEDEIFEDGAQVNRIKKIIESNGKEYADNQNLVYLDASKWDYSELGMLLHDCLCDSADKMYYEEMAECARRLKEGQEMLYQYSDLIDEYVEQQTEEVRLQKDMAQQREAIAKQKQEIAEEKLTMAEEKQAAAEKEAEVSTNCILSLIRQGIVTVEQAASQMSMSVSEFVNKYGCL